MENTANSFAKAGLPIVILTFFIYTAYRFIKALNYYVVHIILQIPLTVQEPLIVIVAGTAGLGARTVAGFIATVALISFLSGRDPSKLFKLIGFALLLEAINALCFIPSAVWGLLEVSPLLWITTGIPSSLRAMIMPLVLLELRSRMISPSESYGKALKWACITGISYLLVSWLNYLSLWFGTFVQPEIYAAVYPGYGTKYVLNYPLNMFSFLLTLIGLPLLAAFFWWSALPVIREITTTLNLRRVGITMTAFAGYFILIFLLFVIFGPVGGYSIWNSLFIHHNVDFWWSVTLPALGIPLMLGPAHSK